MSMSKSESGGNCVLQSFAVTIEVLRLLFCFVLRNRNSAQDDMWLGKFAVKEFPDYFFYVAVLAIDGIVELTHVVVGNLS